MNEDFGKLICTTQSKGYFIIQAPPGMGKSALMAKYIEQSHCLAYFNIRAQGIDRTAQFLSSVCQQLIQRYHLPYCTLSADIIKTDGA